VKGNGAREKGIARVTEVRPQSEGRLRALRRSQILPEARRCLFLKKGGGGCRGKEDATKL